MISACEKFPESQTIRQAINYCVARFLLNQTHVEFLHSVLESEIKYRMDKASKNRIKEAGFPCKKTIESFDLGFQRAITKRQLKQLAELKWIEEMYNLVLLGPPETGKSHLSITLGYHAVEIGYKVSFIPCLD